MEDFYDPKPKKMNKIKAIRASGEDPWPNNQGKVFYKCIVEFDDGYVGRSMSEALEVTELPYNIGDEVEITIKGKYNEVDNIKIKKSGAYDGSGGGKKGGGQDIKFMALRQALDYVNKEKELWLQWEIYYAEKYAERVKTENPFRGDLTPKDVTTIGSEFMTWHKEL